MLHINQGRVESTENVVAKERAEFCFMGLKMLSLCLRLVCDLTTQKFLGDFL